MTVINLTNRNLTGEQIANLPFGGFITAYLPQKLQKLWGQIPTDPDLNFEEYLKPIVEFVISEEPVAVICEGEPTATFWMVNKLMKNNIKVVAPVTERIKSEGISKEGWRSYTF